MRKGNGLSEGLRGMNSPAVEVCDVAIG